MKNITEIYIPHNPNPITIYRFYGVELFDIMIINKIKYYVEKYDMKYEKGRIFTLKIWLAEG